MFKAASRVLAVALVSVSATACIGITKGNPLSLVPASELALIKSSAPKSGGKMSVNELLANARASGKDGEKAEPTESHLDLTWTGDTVEPEPGHLVSLGNFVAAAPKHKITIACGSSLDAVGLKAHRRALAVGQLLKLLGIPSEVKRDAAVSPQSLKLLREGPSA